MNAMNFTIVLRRSASLMEMLDDDCEYYIANPERKFGTMRDAVKAARVEVARSDAYDVRERRHATMSTKELATRDYYEVVMVIEGRPNILAMPGVTLTEVL